MFPGKVNNKAVIYLKQKNKHMHQNQATSKTKRRVILSLNILRIFLVKITRTLIN